MLKKLPGCLGGRSTDADRDATVGDKLLPSLRAQRHLHREKWSARCALVTNARTTSTYSFAIRARGSTHVDLKPTHTSRTSSESNSSRSKVTAFSKAAQRLSGTPNWVSSTAAERVMGHLAQKDMDQANPTSQVLGTFEFRETVFILPYIRRTVMHLQLNF